MRIPENIRDQLHIRAGGNRQEGIPARCEKCGKAGANNAHHRVNASQRGRSILSNLLLLCGSGTTGCHGWVTNHPELARQGGWSVRSYMTPRTVVVSLFGGRRVYLTDGGDYLEVEAA